jgi:endonuclease-3 related protein
MGKLTPVLLQIYGCLFKTFGLQHWWPAESPFEMMAGAVLTQSAAWGNVEKALLNLKNAGALSPEAIRLLPQHTLAQLVRPSGYFNAKAKKLKTLAEWLGGFSDGLEKAFDKETNELRKELLAVHGIGPETADSILLYAAGRPVFVIDAYTRRDVSRLGLASGDESYDALQRLFTANLPADAALFNEYHALLVRLAKESCRKQPRCGDCCLKGMCREGNKEKALNPNF